MNHATAIALETRWLELADMRRDYRIKLQGMDRTLECDKVLFSRYVLLIDAIGVAQFRVAQLWASNAGTR